jgi:hypothetical protein
LLGEAYFMRAFFHFYLVNLFGDVPLMTTSDWRVNAVMHRTPKDTAYKQIIADLKSAQGLLSENFLQADRVTPGGERIRPTKGAAAALLARVYLYTKDWTNAEMQATIVIDDSQLFSLHSLDETFTKNNPEAIWQIQYVTPDQGTEGYHFILTEEPGYNRPTYLSSFLLEKFEAGDQRKAKWISSFTTTPDPPALPVTYYFPYKYKSSTVSTQQNGVYPEPSENLVVLRLAEQYLIRAEARAQQNKISESQSDLNIIRTRAGLANTTATTQTILLTAILHERQVELFTEWGHRWFDLKRTGAVDTVMTKVLPVKRPGFTWNTTGNCILYITTTFS